MDGLKAVLAWAAITVVLVALFKYPGWVISQLVGFVFVVSFIAIWGSKILYAMLSPLKGHPPRPGLPVQPPRPGQQTTSTRRACSTCSGSGYMSCPGCRGMRGRWDLPTTSSGTSQWVPCTLCVGNGSVQCSSCSGLGYFEY